VDLGCIFWYVLRMYVSKVNDLIYFIDWKIIRMNGNSIIMTFLFNLMFLLFMGLVSIASFLIIYTEDYVFGDLSIFQFIMLDFNPLNAELNPIRHLLALAGAHHFVHVSRLRVNVSCFYNIFDC
jgi:hypothetical protein